MLCIAGCGHTSLFYAEEGNVILPLCEDCAANADLQGYETKPNPLPRRTRKVEV